MTKCNYKIKLINNCINNIITTTKSKKYFYCILKYSTIPNSIAPNNLILPNFHGIIQELNEFLCIMQSRA